MSNFILPRFLRNAYRKEPLTGFILAVGTVDMAIGGLGQRWSLLSFGLAMATVAALARWVQVRKVRAPLPEETPRYYLPPRSSGVPLPLLSEETNRR
jgi:hypothetical protein